MIVELPLLYWLAILVGLFAICLAIYGMGLGSW
jgi:hypothetical protein